MGIIWQFALVGVLFAGMIFVFVHSSKYENKAQKTNRAVNNTLADLIDNELLLLEEKDLTYPNVMLGAGSPLNGYADRILKIGFNGKDVMSVKEFHENLYLAHDELINSLDNAVSFHHVDAQTTPEKRIEQGNETMKTLLPFLIIGNMQGTDSDPKNSKYINDESYVGYLNTDADFLMTPM